jgi:ketosteroid isomerase-like protein
MQAALSTWTNHNLFSNHYVQDRLEETQEWEDLDKTEVEDSFETIAQRYSEEMPQLANRNEMALEDKFIRPVLAALDHYWEVQQSVQRNRRTPDYAFFASDDAREKALDRKESGGDVYKNVIGIADAKRWGRNLDIESNDKRDFGNPNYQISYYLQETPPDWGIVTNGRKWRLYYGPTSHKLTSYFEVDLPTILEEEDMDGIGTDVKGVNDYGDGGRLTVDSEREIRVLLDS